ncbi:MAG: arsenate reductase ArsC [Candidatus Zixiibacteriota bacterium]
MKNILFIGTGNSCRSQMAEGYGWEYADRRFDIRSAGTMPESISDDTINVLIEDGIDITDQTSDLLTDDMIEWADIIVSVSGPARDCCPSLPDEKEHIHWDVDNPMHEYHTAEDREAEFVRIRDEIRELVIELFDQL